jgi:hypothetical protein
MAHLPVNFNVLLGGAFSIAQANRRKIPPNQKDHLVYQYDAVDDDDDDVHEIEN